MTDGAVSRAFKIVSEWLREVKEQADLDHYKKVLSDAIKKSVSEINTYEQQGQEQPAELRKKTLSAYKIILDDITKLSIV